MPEKESSTNTHKAQKHNDFQQPLPGMEFDRGLADIVLPQRQALSDMTEPGLPLADSNLHLETGSSPEASIPDQRTADKNKPVYYRLVPGTTLLSGPLGGVHGYLGTAQEMMTVKVVQDRRMGWYYSVYVEVESPPELQGNRYWVTSRPGKNTGFY